MHYCHKDHQSALHYGDLENVDAAAVGGFQCAEVGLHIEDRLGNCQEAGVRIAGTAVVDELLNKSLGVEDHHMVVVEGAEMRRKSAEDLEMHHTVVGGSCRVVIEVDSENTSVDSVVAAVVEVGYRQCGQSHWDYTRSVVLNQCNRLAGCCSKNNHSCFPAIDS